MKYTCPCFKQAPLKIHRNRILLIVILGFYKHFENDDEEEDETAMLWLPPFNHIAK